MLPVDLLLMERAAAFRLREERAVQIGDDIVEPGSRAKELLRKCMLLIWQKRWNRSAYGSVTRRWFPDVTERLRQVWVEPNFYSMQILTGHGDFLAKLNSRSRFSKMKNKSDKKKTKGC